MIATTHKTGAGFTHRKAKVLARRDCMENILRTLPDPALILDVDLRLQMANEAFYQMFKLSPTESQGRLIYELGSRQWNIPWLRGLLEELLYCNSILHDFQITRTFENIDSPAMLLNARKLDAAEGWPPHVLLIIHEITAPKQGEVDHARLAAIVESSKDAIISKSLDGVITSWNAGAERIFGYKAEEAIGQPVTMLIPPDRVNEESAILGRIRRGERIDHYETVRRRKDGALLDISLTVSPIVDGQGKIIGASKIARDISDRKRMEAELRVWHHELESRVAEQKKQLLEEARERKRLEAEVAGAVEAEQLRLGQELHDGLAQELTGIGMMLEVFEQKLMKASPTRAHEARQLRMKLATAAANARNLAKGFYPVEIERYGLLIALQEFARRTEQSFGISCIVEADQNAGIWLKDTRAIQLFRIVQEAVHNATKHASAKNILVRLTTQKDGWALTVKDDGVGLRQDPHKAGGMGLRIMQYRARMIGATCDIHNDKDGGVILSCTASVRQISENEVGNPLT